MEHPKALLFDMFGTVVDWQNTVAPFLKQQADKKTSGDDLLHIDWTEFTKEWRMGYYRKTSQVRSENCRDKFIDVDQIHLELLVELVNKYKIQDLWLHEELVEINQIWHKLDGWPDSSEGLKQLKTQCIVAALTNGECKIYCT